MLHMTAETDTHKAYLWTIGGTWWVDWTPKSRDGLTSGFYFASFEDALDAMPIGSEDDYVPYTTKDQRI